MATAARILDDDCLPRELASATFEALLPDLTTSVGPPAALNPPFGSAERKLLVGEATPEEAREARVLFGKRAEASPNGVFWTCGVPDDDES
jgi:hypothetical protein